jgi:hypothetical protein
MKKVRNRVILLALLLIAGITLSYVSSPEAIAGENNGVEVVITKNQTIYIFGGCIGPTGIASVKSMKQTKGGVVHMRFVMWKLPSNNCLVPAKGVKKVTIGTAQGPQTLLVTSSGVATLKIIIN